MTSTASNSPESSSSVGSPPLAPVDAPVDISSQVAAPDSLEQMNLNTTVPGEDTEMTDAPSQETTNAPISIPSATTKNNPVDVLKKIIYHRDLYLSLMADMITTDSNEPKAIKQLSEVREKIEKMNKDINQTFQRQSFCCSP